MAEGIELPIDLPVDGSEVDAATKLVMQLEHELGDLNKQIAAIKLPQKVASARKELAALKMPDAAPLSRWERAFGAIKSSFTERISAPEGSVGGILLGGIAGGLVVAGAGMVVGAIKSITSAVIDLGVSMLDTAGHAERTDMAFRNLVGTDADQYLEFLESLGSVSEFTGGELKSFGAELLRAGIRGEDFRRSMAAAGDIASRFEDPVRGMSTAIGALSQIELTKSINAGQLRAFGLNDDQFFKDLAKSRGLSVKGLKEAMAAGKIDGRTIREAINASIVKTSGKDLGAQAVDASKGYLAQIKKLKDAPGNIFESLAKTEGFTKITAAVERLQTALNGETGEKLAGGLGKVIDKFGTWLATVDVDKLAANITKAFGAILTIVEKVGNAIGFVVDHWDQLKAAFLLMNPAQLVGSAFRDAGDKASQGFTGGIGGALNAAKEGVKGYVGSITGTFKDALGIHSPSRVFRGFGLMTAAGFSAGLLAGAPMVEGSAEKGIAVPATEIGEGAGSTGAGGGIGAISMGGVSLTVQIQGSTNASAEEIATAVALQVPSAVQEAFERMAQELGRG